jgi:hypothetical protein
MKRGEAGPGKRFARACGVIRWAAALITVVVGACSDSRTDRLVALCVEDDRRTHAECECQARVMRSTLSDDDLDMLLRMGSVKTAEERMAIMREAGRNEQQFLAWGKAFQAAVDKANKECTL